MLRTGARLQCAYVLSTVAKLQYVYVLRTVNFVRWKKPRNENINLSLKNVCPYGSFVFPVITTNMAFELPTPLSA